MSIIEHIEKYLGSIGQAWKDQNSNHGIQVVSFDDTPGEATTTFLSLGLSNHSMRLSDSKSVRQELIISVYSMAISNMIASLMLSLCEAIIGRGKAVLRGEVIPLSKDISARIGFEAVYCTIPVLYDEGFYIYSNSSPATVMVWLLPIYQSEADYIGVHGWECFEDLLEAKDPDLCSLKRSPVI